MEGISGITYKEQTKPGTKAYKKAQEYLMSDLLASIQGAYSMGVKEIVIYDLHEDGKNIDLSQLPEGVSVIVGKPPETYNNGLDATFDGLFIVGNHAKQNTAKAVFPHTYFFNNARVEVNGIDVGEIGMEAMIAGGYAVPLALVTGDKAAEIETKALLPDTITAVVKEDTGFGTAKCYAPTFTRKLIYNKAAEAIRKLKSMKPLILNKPYEITITFLEEVDKKIERVSDIIKVSNSKYILKGVNLHKMWDSINKTFADWL
jgi:D-amino peptidase